MQKSLVDLHCHYKWLITFFRFLLYSLFFIEVFPITLKRWSYTKSFSWRPFLQIFIEVPPHFAVVNRLVLKLKTQNTILRCSFTFYSISLQHLKLSLCFWVIFFEWVLQIILLIFFHLSYKNQLEVEAKLFNVIIRLRKRRSPKAEWEAQWLYFVNHQ